MRGYRYQRRLLNDQLWGVPLSLEAPPPDVTSVSPNAGTESGGTAIQVNGTGFVSGATVYVGGVVATGISFVSPTRIDCNTPAGTIGAANVRVVNPDLQEDTLVGGFTYLIEPTLLVLQGYWRAAYAGSPWNGVASGGGSGGRNLTEATNPPTADTPLNGLNSANFDGTNDLLANATALSSYVSASAYSFWALVHVDSIGTNAANIWDNDPIWCDHTANIGVHMKSGGGGTVHLYHWDGASKSVSVAISTGTPQLIQGKFEGGNLKIRINGGSWQTAAAGNATVLTGTLLAGRNYPASSQFSDMKLYELGITNVALSDTTFNNLKAYINNRYGLSL